MRHKSLRFDEIIREQAIGRDVNCKDRQNVISLNVIIHKPSAFAVQNRDLQFIRFPGD